MIVEINIPLETIAHFNKEFKWPIGDKKCQHCKSKLWGHGYTKRYFHGHNNMIALKRYRCSNQSCRRTITLIPKGYPKSYALTFKIICSFLIHKLESKFWNKNQNITIQRALHWLNSLKIYCTLKIGSNNEGFDLLKWIKVFEENNENFLGYKNGQKYSNTS